jgi:hypothetical protein
MVGGNGMSHKEILEKAIQKAVDGGWDGTPDPYGETSIYDLIFNHDFAKALWGEAHTSDRMPLPNEHGYEGSITPSTPVTRLWEYHLQQMVIADDPIEYLGENL